MNAYQRKQLQKKRKSLFRKWHRRIGLAACILVLHLSITGILLNHYEWFDLHHTHVKSQWLLDWYSIDAPENSQCVPFRQGKICQLGEQIFALTDDITSKPQKLINQAEPLVTAVEVEQMLGVITRDQFYLFTDQGEAVEQLNLFELTGTFTTNAALIEDKIYLKTTDTAFWLDLDNFQVSEVLTPISIFPVRISSPSQEQLVVLQTLYRQSKITYLKLIQDLHSGSFFFSHGKILMDLTALALILLAVSGIIAWQRRVYREKS